ncbi:hypothetical protein BDV30DRAFT_129471 [Aspergillus minisclerotigenes]|uniref:Uncharacterized protein n=1 Tax=Aspergillus minisclerotigenes TaxID=656917 RepID=A0A5N6J0M6_9EURO|nr:hypothetical protein BDV30DRAFT_129471 [Aspergillus minisclerotigenes]
MEALMDRHKLVEDRLPPELEKLKDTSRADLKDVRDKVKDLEGLLVKLKGSLQDLTEQIEEHLNFHQEKDFVSREEWKELKMQVDRNTSNVEDLSIVANGALATTQALLGDLGGRLGNQELIWYSKWVAYANQYTGHITGLARSWRKDNGNVSETQTSTGSHCKGPHRPEEMIKSDRPLALRALKNHGGMCFPEVSVLQSPPITAHPGHVHSTPDVSIPSLKLPTNQTTLSLRQIQICSKIPATI